MTVDAILESIRDVVPHHRSPSDQYLSAAVGG
jgi:hypothetical protein